MSQIIHLKKKCEHKIVKQFFSRLVKNSNFEKCLFLCHQLNLRSTIYLFTAININHNYKAFDTMIKTEGIN